MKSIVLDVAVYDNRVFEKFPIRIKNNNHKNNINSIIKIRNFIRNSIVDASAIMKYNFPNIDSDIFISYSHMDNDAVKIIANKICIKYGWSCFVDSDAWNYYENIIHEIEDEIRKAEFSYYDAKTIRDNVDIMLATSLMNIMNNSKIILLFDTNEYTKYADDEKVTYSSWVYHELCCAKLIDINNLKDKPVIKHMNESIGFKYSLDNYAFDSITLSNFLNWLDELKKNNYSLLSDKSIELLYNKYENSNFINR